MLIFHECLDYRVGEPNVTLAWGFHPIVAAVKIRNGRGHEYTSMISINFFSSGESKQRLLAAIPALPRLLLTEKSSAAEVLISPDDRTESRPDFEGYPHYGIND